MGTGQLIVLTALLLLTSAGYLRYRDALYPPVVQGAVWFGVVLLYVLNQEQVRPLSPALYLLVVYGVLAFSLGSYFATRTHSPVRTPLEHVPFEPKRWYVTVLFWLPLIGLVPFGLKAYAMSQAGPFEHAYMNLRFGVVEGADAGAGGAFGVLAYLVPVSYVSVLLQTLVARYKERPYRYAFSVLVAVAYGLLFTGRGNVLFLGISVVGILLITRRVSPLRTFAVGVAGCVAVFVGLGFLSGKIVGGAEFTPAERIQNVIDVVLIYVTGPLPAFDVHLRAHEAWNPGANTLRAFYALLSEMGFDVAVVPTIQEYEYVPFPINVYTFYRSYLDDYSWAGITLAPLVWGYVHGYIYRRATLGSLLFIVLYGLSLVPILLQFYSDSYLASLSLWLQYGVLLSLFFYRMRFAADESPADGALNPAY